MKNLKTYELLNLLADKLKFAKETENLDPEAKTELLIHDRKAIELIPSVVNEVKTLDENAKDLLSLQFGEVFFKIFSE